MKETYTFKVTSSMVYAYTWIIQEFADVWLTAYVSCKMDFNKKTLTINYSNFDEASQLFIRNFMNARSMEAKNDTNTR